MGAPGVGVKEPVLGEEAPNGDGADPVRVEASVADESAEDELGRDGGVVTADVEEEGLLLGGERPRMAAVLAGIGGECGEAALQEGASPPEQGRYGEGAGDLLVRWQEGAGADLRELGFEDAARQGLVEHGLEDMGTEQGHAFAVVLGGETHDGTSRYGRTHSAPGGRRGLTGREAG